MIYTVTFNPSLDYLVSVNDFTYGKVNRTTDERLVPGGKGINVSCVLSNLGVDTTALGFVADFTGEQLITMLTEKGVSTDFIRVHDGMTRINMKIHVPGNVDSEETEINGQGPVVSEEEIGILFDKLKQLKEDDILVISGSVCKGVSQNIYADIIKICNEKDIKVVLDASGELLLNALEYGPFLIKPNYHELSDIFDVNLSTNDDIIFYGKELQNRGAKNVLISLGAKGAILIVEDGEVYEAKAPQGKVVNAVGAGDSMVAGFLTGYLDTEDYEAALQMGICTGSASAFSEDLATRKEVGRLLKVVRNV